MQISLLEVYLFLRVYLLRAPDIIRIETPLLGSSYNNDFVTFTTTSVVIRPREFPKSMKDLHDGGMGTSKCTDYKTPKRTQKVVLVKANQQGHNSQAEAGEPTTTCKLATAKGVPLYLMQDGCCNVPRPQNVSIR